MCGILRGPHNLVCPMCLGPEETHLDRMEHSLKWIGLGRITTCDSTLDHFMAYEIILKEKIKKNFCILFWLNDILFGGGHKCVSESVSLVKSLS